jgi:ribulose-bisphosphate carboxylase large chain
MGGDYFRSNIVGGYLVGGTVQELHALVETMRWPLGGLRDMLPALSGGLKPSNLMANLKEFGTDIMVLAGTGITGYPGGIARGVEAMREVVRTFLAERK